MASLESKSSGFETLSPHVGFSDITVIIDSLFRTFLCGGKTEPLEYQTCALAFIVEVRREKKHKNFTSL